MGDFFIAVHAGAGYHSKSNEHTIKKVLKKALLVAARTLIDSNQNGTSFPPPHLHNTISTYPFCCSVPFTEQICVTDAVVKAIQVLGTLLLLFLFNASYL